MKLNKIFSLTLALLIVLALSACLPQKQDLSKTEEAIQAIPENWEVFDSPNHKFKLHYPPHWQIQPEIDRQDLLAMTLFFEDQSQEQVAFWDNTVGIPYYQIAVRIEDNPDNLSSLDWVVKQVIPEAQEQAKQRYESAALGSHQEVKETGPVTPPGSGDMTSISFAPDNGKAYTFTYYGYAHEETHELYLEEFEQMLAGLEFTP